MSYPPAIMTEEEPDNVLVEVLGPRQADVAAGPVPKQGGSAMSLTAVPDDDEFCMDGIWMPGRQVRVQHSSARPPAAVAWITDGASSSAGSVWVSLGERAAATGLQPLLLSGLERVP
jgi:hypothetical protein